MIETVAGDRSQAEAVVKSLGSCKLTDRSSRAGIRDEKAAMDPSVDSFGLDFGQIRGGFGADYAARIVPPQDSPIARSIAAATGAGRHQKVDIDVEYPSGNLRHFSFDGVPALSSILTTPSPLAVLVIANGQGENGVYRIDVETGAVSEVFVSTYVERAVSDFAGSRLFLATYIDVVAIGSAGVLWESRRVSLDGIKTLCYENGVVIGTGTDPENNTLEFSIDAATGEATGGFTLFK